MTQSDPDRPKPKDAWDKLGLLGGPLTALVVLIFTLVYNANQDSIKTAQASESAQIARNQLVLQRLDIVAKYYSELMNPDKLRRDFAIRVIKNAGDEELADRLTLQFEPKERDRVFSEVVPATTKSNERTGSTLRGWTYLGTYEASAGQWRTRYFDFSATTPPRQLVGTKQTVSTITGDLNIRTGLPSGEGPMPPALAILAPGQSVHILTVRNWNASGYHWAEVEYIPQRSSP